MRSDSTNGYVEQYTNGTKFCNSSFLLPGNYLMGETALGIVHVAMLLYLFLGISVLTDILHEAVWRITTKTEDIQVKDTEGKQIWIEEPLWNSSIANVTLMAMAASAPEIFLCFFGTFANSGSTPNQIGPIVLIGSASFNMLIGTGISILAASKIKKVYNICSFLTTTAFATLAYIWLFVALLVVSPGVIEIKEAVITLLGYPLLIITIWATEKISENMYKDEETERKRVCRTYLRNLADKHGPGYVLDINNLVSPCTDLQDAERIKEYLKVCLDVDDLSEVSMEELAQVLEPENPIERINYRRGSAGSQYNKAPFVNLKQAKLSQTQKQTKSPLVGFKQSRYLVREGDEVAIIIEKSSNEDLTFFVETIDDVATSHDDYQPISMMMTMSANEKEREICVQVNKNEDLNKIQDREFHLVLKDDLNQEILDGTDTITTLEINDCDDPGYFGFEQEHINIKEFDQQLPITIKRFGGAFGEACVHLSTKDEHKNIQINEKATAGTHFHEISMKEVIFEDCQDELTVNIDLIDYSIETPKMSFVLELQLPESNEDSIVSAESDKTIVKKPRISKRNQCIITIGDTAEIKTNIQNRTNLIKHFIQEKEEESSWASQFKRALVLQPTIDENDLVVKPSGGKVFMHFMMMPWKLLFATIPPTNYLGGWATFAISFIFTGLLSFAVFDVVTSLGCLLDLHIGLQALVLIAIGTNFPDCVANYLSSSDKNQMNADAALQMISASNAVNIFVGLGLPWTIATIYNWQQSGEDFYIGVQETEQITFVLILFFVCSMLALLTLYIRRTALGGELGGSRLGKICSASFLFLLWGLCIVLSGLYMAGNLGPYQVFTPEVAIKATAIGSCPEAIDEPLIYERSGDIAIRWNYPQDMQVSQCRVELEHPSGGQAIDITQFCDCQPGNLIQNSAGCQLPHEYLSLDYGFPTCNVVKARVQVYSNNCWSQPSDWSSDNNSVRVKGCPEKLRLAVTNVFEESVEINWSQYANGLDTSCNNVNNYILEYKEAGGNFYQIDANLNSSSSQFRIFGLRPGVEYVFRGKAVSSTCIGFYSDHLSVTTTFANGGSNTWNGNNGSTNNGGSNTWITEQIPPANNNNGGSTFWNNGNTGTFDPNSRTTQPVGGMSVINSSISAICQVTFQWQQPVSSQNMVITEYQIEVRAKNFNYYSVPDCTPPGFQKSCTIPMDTFRQSPFLLELGDNIFVRGRAQSQYGWSEFSTPHNMLTVQQGPIQPDAPVITEQSSTSISLDWGSYPHANVNNQRTSYDLEWSTDGFNWNVVDSTMYQTSYTYSGLRQGNNYSFRVRATDACGSSAWSAVTSMNVVSTTLPGMVTGVSTYTVDCNTMVSWAPPNMGSSQIQGYTVEVRTKFGQFAAQQGLCQQAYPTATSCMMQMDNLSRAPFNLGEGDPIVVRIAAYSSQGQGPYSIENANGAIMMSPPPSISNAPWLVVKTPISVTIQWVDINNQFGSDNAYEIYWRQGSSGMSQFTKLDDTTQSVFTVNIFAQQDGGGDLYFKVRARSLCGVGSFSPELAVSLGNVPGQMQAITTSIVEPCQLRLSWIEPITNGSPITAYKIEISANNGQWSHLQTSCDDHTGVQFGQCVAHIPMATLSSAPYNFNTGDYLQIRGSAQNAHGWSTPSFSSSNSLSMLTAPGVMARPTLLQTLDNSIIVSWVSLFPCGYDCGEGYSYELQWNNGVNNGFTRLAETPLTSHTVSGLYENRNLQFRVRAHNPCGYGPFSPDLYVQFERPSTAPGRMATPQIQTDDCYLNIIWVSPQSGGSDILGYQLEIKNPNFEQYNSLEGYCGRVPSRTTCQIPLVTLTLPPFNLKHNDMIYIRAAAYNSLGAGQPSPLSSANVRVNVMNTDISNLAILNAFDGTVSLGWDDIFMGTHTFDSRYAYELYTDNGVIGGQFTKIANTNQSQYTVENLTSGTYRFKVRARTPCGEGNYSNFATATVDLVPVRNTEPARMAVLNIEQQDCHVKVSWVAPESGSQPITGYQLQVGSGTLYNDITAVCGVMLYSSSCVIPMQLLSAAPHNMRDGDPVYFRAAAFNAIGQGAWSPINTNPPTMISTPRIGAVPTVVDQAGTYVTISWGPSANQFNANWNDPSVSYELFWDYGRNGRFEKFADTTLTSFTIDSIEEAGAYQFRVRATNDCGVGEYSPVLSVNIREVATVQVPGQVANVSTETVGCSVRMAWSAPLTDGGSPVTQYAIEVRSDLGNFYSLGSLCGLSPRQTSCTVPMSTLMDQPWNLKAGDLVAIRASALNAKGRSVPSQVNAFGSSIYELPATPTNLYHERDSATITIHWDRVFDRATPSNSEFYEIYWDNGESLFQQLAQTTQSQYAVRNIVNSRLDYKFKVRAFNSCGSSPFSDVLHVRSGAAPGQMDRVQTAQEGCNMRFSWSPHTEEGSTSILEYDVEVKNPETGVYHSLGQHCGQEVPSVTCLVAMSVLTESPYYLSNGDRVEARISAYNDYGWSEPSEPQSRRYGAQVTSLPARMFTPTAYSNRLNEITIEWSALNTLDTLTYEVYIKSPSTQRWERVTETTDLAITVSNNSILQSDDYDVKVRAANECGAGPFSEEVTVRTASVPSTIRKVMVQRPLGSCIVHIVWTDPSGVQNIPVTGYSVQIRTSRSPGSDFAFSSENIYCGSDPTETTCLIDMQVLQAEPYNLAPGQVVVARVAAMNEYGTGAYLQEVSDVYVQTVPVQMNKPGIEAVGGNDERVKITWQPLYHSSETGGTELLEYRLYWDQGYLPELSSKITIYDVASSSHVLNVADHDAYAFSIQAYNVCGLGPMSDALRIQQDNRDRTDDTDEETEQDRLRDQLDEDRQREAQRQLAFLMEQARVAREAAEQALLLAEEAAEAAANAGSRADAEEALRLAEEAAEQARQAAEDAAAAADEADAERRQQEADDEDEADRVRDEISAGRRVAAQMNPVNVRVVGCQVRLDWVAPKHFEQENIEDYELQLMSHDGQWRGLGIDDCVTDIPIGKRTWALLKNSCIVGMDTLASEERGFMLDDTDYLYVRARASYQAPPNTALCGNACPVQYWPEEFSCNPYPGDTARSTTCPEMEEPHAMIGDPERVGDLTGRETPQGIELSWTRFQGNYMYELWWCEGACADGYEKVTETAADTFTVNLLGIRGTYHFIVRAMSPCGNGQFSSPAIIEIAAVPSKVQDIKAFEQSQECGVILRWSRPLIGEPILDYTVELKGEDGEWYGTLSTGCGADPNVLMCTFSMTQLQSTPYSLQIGSQVVARAKARNAFGFGEFSDPNEETSVVVRAVPGKMPTIQASRTETEGQIRIYWPMLEVDGSSVESYDLVWDEGNPANYVNIRLVDTVSRFFILEGLVRGVSYNFKVRARNSCGYGEFSDQFNIQLQSRPAQMDMIRTSYTQIPELSGVGAMGCGVVLSWTAPDDGGSPIIAYLIEVQRPETGEWFPIRSCGRNASDTHCQIVMNDLTNAIFGLRQNDPIVVRGAAYNAIDIGPVSPPSEGFQVIAGPPAKMSPPRLEFQDNETLTLVWDEFSGIANGGREIQSYSLFWDAGTDSEVVNNQLMDNNSLTYTIRGLRPDREYTFKLRARNACGYGEFSETIMYSTAGCPFAPYEPAVVELDGTDVLVSWVKPIQRDTYDEILAYQVVFMTDEGRYLEISGCDGENEDIINSRQCRLEMTSIPDYTGLASGNLIKVKVRARNSFCPGPFSEANTVGQVIITCPLQMSMPYFLPNEIAENSITIRWNTLRNFEAGGVGQDLTKFEVQVKPTSAEEWKDRYIWETRNLQFTQTNLRLDFSYSYRVRAWNGLDCYGPWSEAIDVITGVLPEELDPPTTLAVKDSNDEWKVRIKWNKPVEGGEITRYTVKIRTRRPDIGHVESVQCDGTQEAVIRDAECYVDMSLFWQGTYIAERGTIIMATVSAWNAKGQGATSAEGGQQPVEYVPDEMHQPCGQRDVFKNIVKLNWDQECQNGQETFNGGSEIIGYVMQHKETDGPNEQDLGHGTCTQELIDQGINCWNWLPGMEINYEEPYNSYTISHSLEETEWIGYVQYRVAAVNRWGPAKWCWPHLEIVDARPPERCNTPDSTIDTVSGEMKIEWESPNGNGLEITSYVVQIKNANGSWATTNECIISEDPAVPTTIYQSTYQDEQGETDKQHLYCKVKMETLTDPLQYGLPFDELIQIRVHAVSYAGPKLGEEIWSAVNIDCDEEFSVNCGGARTRQKPAQVQRLRTNDSNVDQLHQSRQFRFIQLFWDELLAPIGTGNSIIQEYQLQIKEGGRTVMGQAPWRSITPGPGISNEHIYYDVTPGNRYDFRVRGKNVYGYGPWSDELTIQTGDRPDRMPPLETRNTGPGGFNIQIEWEEPADNGYMIDDYELQILNKASNRFESAFEVLDEDFEVKIESLCNSPRSIVLLNKKCVIHSEKLATTFYGYRSGDLLIARIAAHNQVGWADWSTPNTDGGLIYDLVPFGSN